MKVVSRKVEMSVAYVVSRTSKSNERRTSKTKNKEAMK